MGNLDRDEAGDRAEVAPPELTYMWWDLHVVRSRLLLHLLAPAFSVICYYLCAPLHGDSL